MSERRKLTENELGKLQLYQQLMSIQLSRYMAYSALFVTVQALGLYLATSLKVAYNTDYLWGIGIGTLAIGIILLWFCYFSARNVDGWKDRILDLTQSTDMEDDFRHWRNFPYPWYQKTRGKVRVGWMAIAYAVLGWVWFCVIL